MYKWLIVLFTVYSWSNVCAQDLDVGLVNLVSGKVTFSPPSGVPTKDVQAFMKVREGDRIEIGPGAKVRVVYFANSRQELWVGPASFRTAKSGAQPIAGNAAEVATLPAGVPQRIARVPELVEYAKLGGIQVRGGVTPAQKASLEQQAAVAAARTTYEELRKNWAADDITPELYLYSALHEYLLYDDMKLVVEEMQRRQPGNEDVKALASWVEKRVSR